MGSDYTRMIHPNGRVRVDVTQHAVKERLSEGWTIDPFPDDREELQTKLIEHHKSQPAIVCASGPSMHRYGPHLAELIPRSDYVTWGTNCVFNVARGEPLPCDYLMILDDALWEQNHKQFMAYLKAHPYTLPCLAFTPHESIRYHHVGINMHATPDQQPAYRPGSYFHGSSSGVAAIQMAMHCGCNPIYLVGHDCGVIDGNTHGHGVRSGHELKDDYPQGLTMLAGYGVVAAHAKRIGIEVYNLSPNSRLTCFEKRDFYEEIR